MRSRPSPVLDLTVNSPGRAARGAGARIRALLLFAVGLAAFLSLAAALASPGEHRAEVGLWIGPDSGLGLDAVAIAPLAQSEALKQETLAALSRRHGADRIRAALPATTPTGPLARLGTLLVSPAHSAVDHLIDGLSRRLSVDATSPTTLVVAVTARDATIAQEAASAFASDLSSRLDAAFGRPSSVRQTTRSVAPVPRIDGLTLVLSGLFFAGAAGTAAWSRHTRVKPADSTPLMPMTAALPAAGAEWVVARMAKEPRFPLYPGEDGRSRALATAVWANLEHRSSPARRLVLTGAKAGRLRLASALAELAAHSGRRALIVDLAEDLAGSADMVRAGFRDLAAGLAPSEAVIVREASSGVHFIGRGFARDASDEEAVADVLIALEAAYDLVIVLADEHTDTDPLEVATYQGAVALIVAQRSDARIWPRLDSLTAAGVCEALLCPLDRNAVPA